MTLGAVRRGGRVRVLRLPDGSFRAQLIRIGIMEGAELECLERLPGGTLVLAHSRQEVALSAELAASITVSPVE
ncbi:MAG: ferrous iron transport protein A [Ignavibacteriae bacterium]|nr:ferrous iron transport protein A [Ignavibacteriota bacterium]